MTSREIEALRAEAESDPDDGYLADSGCYACGGRHWVVNCIDDMCNGHDYCIHGDDPDPCKVCNPDGAEFEGFFV